VTDSQSDLFISDESTQPKAYTSKKALEVLYVKRDTLSDGKDCASESGIRV